MTCLPSDLLEGQLLDPTDPLMSASVGLVLSLASRQGLGRQIVHWALYIVTDRQTDRQTDLTDGLNT